MTEFLKEIFGDAVTDEVLGRFKSELGRKFVAKSDYNTRRDELKDAREEIERLKKHTEELKSRAENADNLARELAELQVKYDNHVDVLNGEIAQIRLEGEISSLIRKMGGKNEKAVRALLTLDGESPEKCAEEQLALLKKSDPYLFDAPPPSGTRGNFPRGMIAPQEGLTYSQMMQLEENRI